MTNNVKVQRAIKNIGQSELAEKLGVSRQTIHSIESGKFVPSTLLALKLAKVFEVPVEEIFQLEEKD
ncbi:MAG TPA: helix-turn-helix transcriptional regulator [Adhaeribacter sp.]|nr:helix-turn-helix transcriptional regulator [Adhaeribacter sp.]